MKTSVNKYGALSDGTKVPGFLSHLAKRDLRIFPVPGLETFLAKGFNPYSKRLRIAETPRHANVLLVALPLSENLKKAAAVTFAQMPRPRILVFVGTKEASPLNNPDLVIGWNEINSLPLLLKNRNLINSDTETFEPAFFEDVLNEENKMQNGHQHDHHNHEGHHSNGKHESEKEKEDKSKEEDGGGMGFMSMVKMTKGKLAGKDGLVMDRNETYFGPFHSGLPDGICIKMTLDGDTVIHAEVDREFSNGHNLQHFPKNPLELPDFMADCFPREAETFRELTRLALLNSSEGKAFPHNPIPLEKERLLNHLLWLVTLLRACSDRELVYAVVQTIQDLQGNTLSVEKIQQLDKKISKRWYLKNKLQNLATIPKNLLHHFSGPISMAAGKKTDLSPENASYPNFKPVALQENNAWGHLQLRIAEIAQSFEILEEFKNKNFDSFPESKPEMFKENQTGSATMEIANGKACLQVEIEDGNIKNIELSTPSTALAALVPTLTGDLEVGDAIVTIASLGISTLENKL